jgi:hypothetical protein
MMLLLIVLAIAAAGLFLVGKAVVALMTGKTRAIAAMQLAAGFNRPKIVLEDLLAAAQMQGKD